MPPATTKCSICGQIVMKSQTYATGQKNAQGQPLRACKCHVKKQAELKHKYNSEPEGDNND